MSSYLGSLVLACCGPISANAAGVVVYSENFNNPGFRGSFVGVYTSENWTQTNTYTFHDYDGWVFTGGIYYSTNLAGTDGAVWLNEVPANATASTTVNGLVPGAKYSLTFNEWGDNIPGSPYVLKLALNGQPVFTYNGTDGGAGALPGGRLLSVPFTATSTSESIEFPKFSSPAPPPSSITSR